MNSIPWITPVKADGTTKLRLFCFPFAGGVSSYFNAWQPKIAQGVELCPVMLPGREKLVRQTPISDIHQLCNALLDQLDPHINVPFVFFGHSMGALIAYELAQLMCKLSITPPLHLFLSAFPAPGLLARPAPIHNLSDSEFKAAIASFNGTPQEVLDDDALMSVILPYLRADFKMVETYTHKHNSRLPVPISVYGGKDDYITRNNLAKWKDNTLMSWQLHMFTGGHFYLSSSSEFHQVMNRELIRLMAQVDNSIEMLSKPESAFM